MRRLGRTLLACAWLGGCAPSVRDLADRRHFAEAMCGAVHFDQDPRTREYVVARMDQAADPAVSVHAVTREELRAAVGDRADAIYSGLVILRVVVSAHVLDVSPVDFDVALDAPGAERVALDRQVLADAAGETLPPAREVVVDPGGRRVVKVDPGLFLGGALELLTLGAIPVTELTGHVRRDPKVTRVDAPSDNQYLRQAPVSSTLFQGMAAVEGEPVDGLEPRKWVALFARPTSGRAEIVIGWRYESYSESAGACELVRERRFVVMGPGSLEEQINRALDERMVSLGSNGEVSP